MNRRQSCSSKGIQVGRGEFVPWCSLLRNWSQVSAILLLLAGVLLSRMALAQEPQPIFTFNGHSGSVNSVAFSPDGTMLVTGSYDGTIKLWDVATGQEIFTLKAHTLNLYTVSFSPDGSMLLTGGNDISDDSGVIHNAKLWNVISRQEIRVFRNHGYAAAFSPDGNKILLPGEYGSAVLREINTGQIIQTFLMHEQVDALAYSPDGTRARLLRHQRPHQIA